MATKHPLRRSCAFCRARKIKCSNETICEACRRQGADCIYDFEARPRRGGSSIQDGKKMDLDSSKGRRGSSSTTSPFASSPAAAEDVAIPVEVSDNVALILEQRFHHNFAAEQDKPAWRQQLAFAKQELRPSLQGRRQSMVNKFSPQNFKYTDLLSLLTQDLVGLVTQKLASLGSHQIEQGGGQFILSGLAGDTTPTMFESGAPESSPLAAYPQRQQTQLIDVWYSVHPLSFLVSKTLLLREIRDGTHDDILLAAMFADASFSMGEDIATQKGQALLQWATSQLRTRPVPTSQLTPTGGKIPTGISTRILSGLSTAQALVLIAWNALSSLKFRRAICYLEVAGRITADIKEHICNTAFPTSSSRINGIEVFNVEREIIDYLYWTTYSLSLWVYMQTGKGFLSGSFTPSMAPIFLPMTENDSINIRLDVISENFSTLQKQKSIVRGMWPLAHISSIISYITALSSRVLDQAMSPTMTTEALQPNFGQEAYRVLTEGVEALSQQFIEPSSRSLVLVIYHTMAVHVLFPAQDALASEAVVTSEVIENFASSANDILNLFDIVPEQLQDVSNITTSLQTAFPDAFCMLLDSCARALSVISGQKHSDLFIRPSLAEQSTNAQWMQVYDPTLEALTSRLYAMSQDEFLVQGSFSRMVRRHLRARVRAFGGSPGSDSSGSPSPGSTTQCLPSMPHTPLRSPGFPPPPGTPSSAKFSCNMEQSDLPTWISPSTSMSNSYTAFDELNKPDWRYDALLHDTLDANAMVAPSGEYLNVTDMMDFQSPQCLQLPTVMDFQGSGQWNTPDLSCDATSAGTESDSIFYYFDGNNTKRA